MPEPSPTGGRILRQSLVVSAAGPSDAQVVASLLEELGYPSRGSEMAERMAALPPNDNIVLLASDRGRGLGLAVLHRMRVLHAQAPTCYITAFVVSEKARGNGVGRRLLEGVEEWARARGCGKITVTSAEHREAAHKFYPSCGFKYTGRRYVRELA